MRRNGQTALLDLEALKKPKEPRPKKQGPKTKKQRQKEHEMAQVAEGDMRVAEALIIKRLESVADRCGQQYSVVFDDFLDICNASLEMLPHHLASALRQGTMAEDLPEVKELWQTVIKRYDRADHAWEMFKESFWILMEFGSEGLWSQEWTGNIFGPDLVGHTYQTWAMANPKWHAQYFTPWNVSYMMAQMVMLDIDQMIFKRVMEALKHPDNIIGQAVILAGLLYLPQDGAAEGIEAEHFEKDEVQRYFFNRVLPAAIPYFDTIKFLEPCVGSGIMMLAAARSCPSWAVHMGLIEFYAMDLDRTCVKMAELNCRLYGLNSYHVRHYSQLTEQEIASLPERIAELYAKAAEVEANEQLEEAERKEALNHITEEIKAVVTGTQLSMFD